jgi:hypothetical protein
LLINSEYIFEPLGTYFQLNRENGFVHGLLPLIRSGSKP